MFKKVLFTLLAASFIVIPCFSADDTLFPLMIYGSGVVSATSSCPLTATPALREYSIDACLGHKKELNLSSQQEKALRDLRDSYFMKIKLNRVKIAKLENELDYLYSSKELDYKSIDNTVTSILTTQNEMYATYLEMLNKADALLTQWQKEKFRSLNANLLAR